MFFEMSFERETRLRRLPDHPVFRALGPSSGKFRADEEAVMIELESDDPVQESARISLGGEVGVRRSQFRSRDGA